MPEDRKIEYDVWMIGISNQIIAILVCQECGALVSDETTKKHTDWHKVGR